MAVPADVTLSASQQGRYGVAIGIRTRYTDWPVVVLRTSDDGTLQPATGSAFILTILPPSQLYLEDLLPNDGANRWYAAYHYRPGYDPAPTSSTWVNAAPVDLDEWLSPYQDYQTEARRRGDTFYSGDGVLGTAVLQDSAGINRVLVKGYLSGESSDGASVTFDQNFDAPPTVLFGGGITYQPASSEWSGTYSSTKPQYVDTRAVGLTVSGFTLYAKLVQKGTVSTTGVNFASNSLTTQGATISAPASSSASGYVYTSHYSVNMNAVADPGYPSKDVYWLSVVVARDSYDGATWTERGTQSYNVSAAPGTTSSQTWAHEQKNDALSTGGDLGASSTDNWRLRVKSVTEGGVGAGDFTVHGFTSTDVTHGITWSNTSQSLATRTPTSEDLIKWEAMAV